MSAALLADKFVVRGGHEKKLSKSSELSDWDHGDSTTPLDADRHL